MFFSLKAYPYATLHIHIITFSASQLQCLFSCFPHRTVSSLWIETIYKYSDTHNYPNSRAPHPVHVRHFNVHGGELKWICLKVIGSCGDSLVMISIQQFLDTQLINANPLSKMTVSAKLCGASKCFWTVIVTAAFRNGTQSTFERLNHSQDLLPLKWPWKKSIWLPV